MVSKFRKTTILLIVFFLMVIILALFFVFNSNKSMLSNERIHELREFYPAFNQSSPLSEQRDLTFEEVINLSETYIIGEVVKPLSNYEVDLSGEPGGSVHKVKEKLRDKGVATRDSIEYLQYEIKAIETIAGEPVNDTIIVTFSSDKTGYFPSFDQGKKFILPLGKEKGSKIGKYGTTKYGLYYIVDENYALSVVENSSTKAFNGKSVDEIVKTIREKKMK
ncbi:hypothetical protein [Paenibacillus aquistagni]|uniref:hypothetical protein n=1 Tax=Paenibacillus aquistagni TaxID=1852522 RepID=UPI00145B9F42|nr:hypothetical protein [Paenibacillus aquistagni]NMM52546.1 hypothetical protein [Paenibacillus aquistagni]